jgi:hypothetical protein
MTIPKEQEKRSPDWERIEADYRAGALSLREIATKDGHVTEGAIRKRAKKLEWTRDLAARISAKADDLVRKETVRKEGTQLKIANPAADRLIVEANAEAIARVRLSHRTDISKARSLCLALLGELEVASQEALTIQQLADLLDKAEKGDDGEGKGLSDSIWKALDRAMQLPGRAGTLKALSDSLRTLITLEREAWGLAAADSTPDRDASAAIVLSREEVAALDRKLDDEV